MVVRIIDDTTYHSGIGIALAQLVFASHADLWILFEWATPDKQFAMNKITTTSTHECLRRGFVPDSSTSA
jgi:hypothetical protein